MKKIIFIGIFSIFLIFKGSAFNADTLVLDGYVVELEKDTVPFLDPTLVQQYKQDLKDLPPVIIWYQSIGVNWMTKSSQFDLGDNRTALMAMGRKARQDNNSYWGLSANSTFMINNNIGLSLGAQWGRWNVSTWSAIPPVLDEGTVAYKLGYLNEQLEMIIKKPVGEDLWELDTLQVPVTASSISYQNIQVPLTIQYVKESRSNVWRWQGGIGVVLNQWQSPSFQYTYTKDKMVYVDLAPSKRVMTFKPAYNLEIQRCLSSSSSVFLKCSGQWPSSHIVQNNWNIDSPSFWLSMGWVWKFNNNPYIRAR